MQNLQGIAMLIHAEFREHHGIASSRGQMTESLHMLRFFGKVLRSIEGDGTNFLLRCDLMVVFDGSFNGKTVYLLPMLTPSDNYFDSEIHLASQNFDRLFLSQLCNRNPDLSPNDLKQRTKIPIFFSFFFFLGHCALRDRLHFRLFALSKIQSRIVRLRNKIFT